MVGTLLVAGGPILISYGLTLKSDGEVVEDGGDAIWLGAFLCLVGVGLLSWNQIRSSRADTERSSTQSEFNDSLNAVLQVVSQYIASPRNTRAKQDFFDNVVRTAVPLFLMRGSRVCVYELEGSESKDGDTQYLTRRSFSGRGDTPRAEFNSDSPHGKRLIDVASGTQYLCVPYPVRKEKDQVDRPNGTTWHAFFAVPIIVDNKPRGVLSIDTREKRRRFTEDEIAVAHTVAFLIGIGLAKTVGAAKDTKPELDELRREAARRGISFGTPSPGSIVGMTITGEEVK
ncbi:GAF domain-containing protein [Leucobacter chromiireducens]|uniref:GAF domain-containing protein n=1 Tax=Leucobacter chromiireducens TaxID=283877 RepID=UPI00192744D0